MNIQKFIARLEALKKKQVGANDSAALLTPDELVARWEGETTVGTLAHWRCTGRGPAFTKVCGRVLYPLESLKRWEQEQLSGAVETTA